MSKTFYFFLFFVHFFALFRVFYFSDVFWASGVRRGFVYERVNLAFFTKTRFFQKKIKKNLFLQKSAHVFFTCFPPAPALFFTKKIFEIKNGGKITF